LNHSGPATTPFWTLPQVFLKTSAAVYVLKAFTNTVLKVSDIGGELFFHIMGATGVKALLLGGALSLLISGFVFFYGFYKSPCVLEWNMR
jgi:hypothetical protein